MRKGMSPLRFSTMFFPPRFENKGRLVEKKETKFLSPNLNHGQVACLG